MTEFSPFIDEQAKIFKALGHPSRLKMVDALRNGEKCVCDLQSLVGDDMSTVSRHLSVLKTAGIVNAEKRGTNIYYRLTMCCLDKFLQCTADAIRQQTREKFQKLA